MRDKDELKCKCGETLISWNGGEVWDKKLLKDLYNSA